MLKKALLPFFIILLFLASFELIDFWAEYRSQRLSKLIESEKVKPIVEYCVGGDCEKGNTLLVLFNDQSFWLKRESLFFNPESELNYGTCGVGEEEKPFIVNYIYGTYDTLDMRLTLYPSIISEELEYITKKGWEISGNLRLEHFFHKTYSLKNGLKEVYENRNGEEKLVYSNREKPVIRLIDSD